MAVCLAGCIGETRPPPTVGFGEPYHGTGQGLYVKDSRGDWAIYEGAQPITSEQALEASGDAEYEARRQIARDYNVKLYREGLAHRTVGYAWISAGVVGCVAGIVLGLIVPKHLQEETTTPATATSPEMRVTTSGTAATLTANLGLALFIGGIAGMAYGSYGINKVPPYVEWHTPPALNRPAYVRQHTEPYNEKVGAPPISTEQTR
ncbi:MAG: hypothetical protein QM831_05765 [Kofleriaceae bacterium]